MEEKLMNPNARFRINDIRYKISIEPPVDGDLVIDIRNCTFGYHDGVSTEGYIDVREGNAIELGCPKDKIKKLIPC